MHPLCFCRQVWLFARENDVTYSWVWLALFFLIHKVFLGIIWCLFSQLSAEQHETNHKLWEPKFNSLRGVTLTCWTSNLPLSSALNGSLIRTSNAPWRALLLMPASLLKLSVHRSSTMLNVYLLRGPALAKHGPAAGEVCRFQPRRHLISALISFTIRCSGCFHILWHSTATDAAEVTYL